MARSERATASKCVHKPLCDMWWVSCESNFIAFLTIISEIPGKVEEL